MTRSDSTGLPGRFGIRMVYTLSLIDLFISFLFIIVMPFLSGVFGTDDMTVEAEINELREIFNADLMEVT